MGLLFDFFYAHETFGKMHCYLILHHTNNFVHGYRLDVSLDAVIILCFMSVPDFIFYITSLLYVGDVFCVAG